jgi:branched-chain amino acid transport system ATP-binding protein
VRLELDGVTAGYGDTTVLRGVSLTLPAGKVVALLGPNGAGKSTTLSVLSGLMRPTKGHVRLGGEDVTGLAPNALVERGLCHITESGATFPNLTVADNLRMFTPRGADPGSTAVAVEAFPRLRERSSQIAGTLSGGEQRMLALARAYAQEPSVVLLDEISLGLAPIIVDEIFEHLGRLASSGASLLVVEQYVRKVLAIADLVYVISRGRIVFAGEPDELAGSAVLEQYLGAEAV